MPWVRLHALRGYRDLLVESVQEGVHVTINVVPSLLDQLLYYAYGGDDPHLALTRRDVASLRPEEAAEVCATFPNGNHAMSDAHPSYRRLRRRIEGGHRPSSDELRDLQVWSTLAWFGATAVRDFPVLGELWAKGADFDDDDKAAMLEVQDAILRDLPARLRALAAAEGPELSTTPYYHPILPLLVDARHGKRSLPGLPEVDFAWPDDALRQLTDARARMREVLGEAPVGLWPSEGSVSPEVVSLASQAGFQWLATDEGVLAASDVERHRPCPGGWDLGHGVTGFFRDRDLSDRIGFHYAKAEPRAAAAELLGLARARAGQGVLLVALDGENPWEAFRDAGAAFRGALYAGLRDQLPAITLSEATHREPVGRVRRLHTGSWIQANFAIWIGHEDDRRAWSALGEAREVVARCEDAARRERAMKHLLAAEGSDWTWWYGTEFSTPYARHFDALFRDHLRAAWEVVGQTPPPSLDRPIGRATHVEAVEPARVLAPALVEDPPWVHWTGAGELRWSGGAMAFGTRHLDRIRFGWSADGDLWLRIDLPSSPPHEPGARWRIWVGQRSVDVPYGARGRHAKEGIEAVAGRAVIVVRSAPAAEVRIEVARGDSTVEYPPHGAFRIPRPEREAMAWWSV